MTLCIDIKVIPKASRLGFFLDKTGTLKCGLKSPPTNNLANRELIALVAKTLHVPNQAVEIISGLTSRTKRLKIAVNCSQEQFLVLLGLKKQPDLFER